MADSSIDQADLARLLGSPQQWPNFGSYQPLNESRSEIRVLLIWHENDGAEIHAAVVHKSLEDDLEYDALSYYWGPPDEQKPIYIDDQPVLVRRSLYSFLDSLCHQGQVLPVWLDSICINQRDARERNFQVAMMGDVYSNATCVRAWIGETDADLEYSFAYSRNRRHQRLLNSEYHEQVVKRAAGSFRQVMSRPYWRRLWIIQEIVLARKVVVMAGRRSIDLDDFISVAVDNLCIGTFLESLSKLRQRFNMKGKQEKKPRAAIRRVLDQLKDPEAIAGVLQLEEEMIAHRRAMSGEALSDDLPSGMWRAEEVPDDHQWLASTTLLGRMLTFGNHLCENPRDKIFGLISLAKGGSPIEVDYEKTVGELMSELVYGLAEAHRYTVYGPGIWAPSPYAVPLQHFEDLLKHASEVATSASLSVADLLLLNQPEGFELCVLIDETETMIYGQLTPSFAKSGNWDLCSFRRWNDYPIEFPLAPYHTLGDITRAQDTNFYQMAYNQNSKDTQLCFYLGDREPDPLQCLFFTITPVDEVIRRTASAFDPIIPDRAKLVIEFREDMPRIAGVLADLPWWDTILQPKTRYRRGLSDNLSFVEIFAMLLLRGEIQLCLNVHYKARWSGSRGAVHLRLHCSRMASLMLFVVGPYNMTDAQTAEIISDFRTIHPQVNLCGCEYEADEHVKVRHLARTGNMFKVRGFLKEDMEAAQMELSSLLELVDVDSDAEDFSDSSEPGARSRSDLFVIEPGERGHISWEPFKSKSPYTGKLPRLHSFGQLRTSVPPPYDFRDY